MPENRRCNKKDNQSLPMLFFYIVFQSRLKYIMELAISVKHLRLPADSLISPILLGFLIILKDKCFKQEFDIEAKSGRLLSQEFLFEGGPKKTSFRHSPGLGKESRLRYFGHPNTPLNNFMVIVPHCTNI